MNRNQFALAALIAAALAGSSSLALAADAASDTTRQQRMDDAYDSYKNSPNYRAGNASSSRMSPSADPRNPNPGAFARGENSVKDGAKRTGHAIKNGAKKAGHAIGTGVRKTGEAVGRTGEKLQDKSAPSN